jgi:hypothetical protein
LTTTVVLSLLVAAGRRGVSVTTALISSSSGGARLLSSPRFPQGIVFVFVRWVVARPLDDTSPTNIRAHGDRVVPGRPVVAVLAGVVADQLPALVELEVRELLERRPDELVVDRDDGVRDVPMLQVKSVMPGD